MRDLGQQVVHLRRSKTAIGIECLLQNRAALLLNQEMCSQPSITVGGCWQVRTTCVPMSWWILLKMP